jgi:hypothetical protein
MAFFQNVVLPYDGDECLTWPYADDGKGYGVLWIDKALAYVHRLTCQEQNGPAPSPEHEAAHECGKGHLGCVTKRHMAWKTHADNMDDKFIHGTVQRGEEVGTAKLQLEQVRQIKRKTMRAEDAAEKFGVSIATVYSIRRGENWGWVNV